MLLRPPPFLFAALTFSSLVHAEDLQLAPVEVTTPEAGAGEVAQAQLKSVPGATNYIDMSSVQQGRVSTNEDVFKYQPGVYAKAANNEGVKLSIRGSGLNRSPGAHASGLYEMFDGLPLTGPGGTPYELKDPLWQSRVEVLRGANGFDQGALALGGAVNYVTHTGYDAPKLQVRYEAGSRGYAQREISSGQVLGDADYYISLTDSESDGYQRQSAATGKGMAANFGYRFNPDLETRFYFRYRETTNDTPGKLTRAPDQPRPACPPTVSTLPAIPSACNQAPPGSPTRPPCSWTTIRAWKSGWPITITRWTCAKAPTASRWPTPISAAP